MEVHIDRIVPAGDEVFVRLRVHLRAPRGGLLLDGPIFETVSIKHGKLSRIRLFLEEREALEAAGRRDGCTSSPLAAHLPFWQSHSLCGCRRAKAQAGA